MKLKRIFSFLLLIILLFIFIIPVYAQPHDNSTLKPTKVWLDVGEVVNYRFKVSLNISPEIAIAGATVNIEYDSSVLELKNSKINSDSIGGIPVDSYNDGKYTFTYMNTEGSTYNGVYSTLTFRIKDKAMTSSIIYLNVTSLEDKNLLSISHITENGIVEQNSAEPANVEVEEHEYTNLNIEKTKEPIPLVTLEIADIKYATVFDGQVALIEDGMLTTFQDGETNIIVTHNDDSKSYYKLIISQPKIPDINASADKKQINVPIKKGDGRLIAIVIIIILAIMSLIIETIIIVKPFRRIFKKKTTQSDKAVVVTEKARK